MEFMILFCENTIGTQQHVITLAEDRNDAIVF